jgi:OOP family OmpA-OmpF porin
LGGFDIYSIRLDSRGMPLGSPVNLGGTINSNEDEITPFYYEVSSTLYYATAGKVGLGGLDVFSAQRIADDWKEPVNMGAPINSSGDDAYFVLSGNGNKGYLSSDRDKGCCYEIFDFEMVYKVAAGFVYDKVTGEKIDGASITLRDSSGTKVIATTITDNGLYALPIEQKRRYKVEATHPDYLDGKTQFQTYLSFAMDSTWANPILMIPTKSPDDILLDNIYYDYGKSTLRPESYPSLDFLAEQLNKYGDLNIELGSHTDSKGKESYNLNLSNKRSQSCVNYLIMRGVDKSRLIAKGFGESKPVAPNTNPDGSDNPDGRQKNRRTTFRFVE